ncbi:MAG TPA: threonine synthase [Saprospiraceae bacterium]|nr:threonine synthase [Saprospiraceae bacterium]
MKFISTAGSELKLGFKESVRSGLAPDGGLLVPEFIPVLRQEMVRDLLSLSNHELAFALLTPYVKEDLTVDQLNTVIDHAFQFDIPLKRIGESDVFVLELFHGPTWAFKDVGARFLAGCLSAWSEEENDVTILVATSGDTGGAVANGFYNQPGTKVVILYPAGKVSPLQEQQIAGLGGNITAVAVQGNFDDCQQLVKKAFSDKELRNTLTLTSANSINVARWLPQMVYYAFALKAAIEQDAEFVFSVPSGNYGNITAGLLLHSMGMKLEKFIAAHNANDTIPRLLQDGIYEPYETIPTVANAMDVSDPSNFLRLQYLWDKFPDLIDDYFVAESIPDHEILESIQKCWKEHSYLLDPHTATAWKALNDHGAKGIILSTAHPYKFEEIIIKALGLYPENWKKEWTHGKIDKEEIGVDYDALKRILNIEF